MTTPDLTQQLLKDVVEPILDDLPPVAPDPNVPERVHKNRQRRAAAFLADVLAIQGSVEVAPSVTSRVRRVAEAWSVRGFEPGFDEADTLEIELATAATDPAAAHAQWLRATYGRVEIRGLQTSARVMQDLDVVWVPLHVMDPDPEYLEVEGQRLPIHRRSTVPKVLVTHPRLLLVGAPGSGKSTLVRYLATRAQEQRPVFVVAVRALSKGLTVDEIARCNEVSKDFVNDALIGPSLLLVDGVVEGGALHVNLLAQVAKLGKRFPAASVVVTSRPAGVQDAKVPTGFVRVQLQSLERGDIDRFVEKWCLAAEVSITRDRALAEERAKRASTDLKQRIGKSRAVAKLADNPLLASVVCVVHRFMGQRIPERRAALYEVCTNVLLYEWDRAKFPDGSVVGSLDAEQKRLLLADLALRMHEQEVTAWSEQQICEVFAARLPELGVDGDSRIQAASLLAEIRDRSGMLVEESPGSFGFSHLTFQEYLSAVELVRRGRIAVLVERSRDEWWQEVAMLACGLPRGPVEALVDALLEDADDGSTVLAARCLDAALSAPTRLRDDVSKALEGLIPPDSWAKLERLSNIGALSGPLLMRTIRSKSPLQRLRSALAIATIRHEPGYAEILALLGDKHRTKPYFDDDGSLYEVGRNIQIIVTVFPETLFAPNRPAGWKTWNEAEWKSHLKREQIFLPAWAPAQLVKSLNPPPDTEPPTPSESPD